MSSRKYLVGILLGISAGLITTAVFSSWKIAPTPTRSLASERTLQSIGISSQGVSAVTLSLRTTPESRPEDGYYKLVANVSLLRPLANLRFQWALPSQARVVTGAIEGDIHLISGENFWQNEIEIQLTDLKIEQHLLFDISFDQNGLPSGASQIFVFHPQGF